MKIAITGGAGFIGAHIAQAYLDAGHDVLIIDTFAGSDSGRWASDVRARYYQLDIRDEKIFTLLQNERPDVVSHHVAGQWWHDHADLLQSRLEADVQVRGLLNMLESCAAASVRHIIFASGGNTLYGCAGRARMQEEREETPISVVTENAALCPRSPQDIHSVAGEWYLQYYARRSGFKHTILRYADVYGETRGDFVRHPLDYFSSTLLVGRSPIIRGAIDEVHDHIFIDDVVRANLLALEHGWNQTFHISSGEGHTVRELYQAVASALNSDIEPVYISNSLVRPSSIIMDNTRARNLLCWQPRVSLEEGIQQTISRMRQGMEVEMVAHTLVGASR